MNRAHSRHGAPVEGGIFAEGISRWRDFISFFNDIWFLQFRHPERSETKTFFSRGIRPDQISFRSGGRPGFTLLEMCMVLLILAILAGLSMPAMESAFTERAVRVDAHQLALMVKTAMIQSAEQHRPYVIDLTTTTMALHPQGTAAADPSTDATTDATTDDSSSSTTADVSVTSELAPPNELLTPDPSKVDGWMAMPDGTQWVFQPGELCPATRVRFKRGEAWLEMGFGSLTGNVEDEKNYLP